MLRTAGLQYFSPLQLREPFLSSQAKPGWWTGMVFSESNRFGTHPITLRSDTKHSLLLCYANNS